MVTDSKEGTKTASRKEQKMYIYIIYN